MKVLQVKNLSKKYNDLEVLKNISLEVEEGETLVILGASGSGKSTLLRCINNLEKVSAGNIIINGKEMIKEYKNNEPIYNNKKFLNEINLETGMVFQDFNLFPHLSVLQNITEALKYVSKLNKLEAENKAKELLKKMDLLNKAEVYPCNLSGGQKQRVSIARCLALDPKIICMDEPTSALDPELVGEVLKVIKKLAMEKRTMIIVTHEIRFAEEVADRIIFMDSGKIVEEGIPKEIIRNPKRKRTRDFLKRYINIDQTKKENNLSNIRPKKVIKFFEEISNIPRKSGNEEAVKNYLINFAKKRNLEYYQDEFYNVIIRKNIKDAANIDLLAFQAHTDMICEKDDNVEHDFNKEPIKLIKDGDFIKADGTTLGADNGIGVAYMLAILDTTDAPVECIFTTQEETTMIGAKKINVNKIKAKKIISLDNGKEGQMVISSANCLEWFGKIKKEYESNNYENTYELEYSNFKGGHSGLDIADKTRENPIKLGIKILSEFENICINKIEGGSRVNVIPRDFKVIFSSKEDILNLLEEKIKKQESFLGDISIKKVAKMKECFSLETTKKIISFVNNYKNGVIKFNDNKNVILSANFGAIREIDDYIRLEYSLRSNDMAEREKYLENLKALENNIEIIWQQELKGFEPDYNSDLALKASKVYEKVFGKEISKIVVQGVLEGGIFKDRIKDLEYICIGVNIYDAHSPKERVSIKSIKKTWKYINEILKDY